MEFHDSFFLVCVTTKSWKGAVCPIGFQQLAAASRPGMSGPSVVGQIDFFSR
ncbi:hypothetical protein [Microcoleus sp. S36bC1]|uniref:hypothetical protein n=1 Tax=Microcoleus sp. S36bC1 TaxID=2818945 RepID=UPI002FD6AD63